MHTVYALSPFAHAFTDAAAANPKHWVARHVVERADRDQRYGFIKR